MKVDGVASRACWKFQEKVDGMAQESVGSSKKQLRDSVASRACWKFQERFGRY